MTLRRVRAIVIFLWLLNTANALQPLWHVGVFAILTCTMILICLVTSTYCYSKIYWRLRRMQAQVQDSLHSMPSSANLQMNMARYKKSVGTAFLVYFALITCYTPYTVVSLRTGLSNTQTTIGLLIAKYFTINLIYFNSSINPALYCWRIKEVRQLAKDILKQFACRSS